MQRPPTSHQPGLALKGPPIVPPQRIDSSRKLRRAIRPRRIGRALWKGLVVFVGMSGLRLDRMSWNSAFILWVAVWLSSAALYGIFFEFEWAPFNGALHGDLSREDRQLLSLYYVTLIGVIYYGGLCVTLGTPLRLRLIRHFGVERSYKGLEAVLGVVFLHHALCQTAVMKSFGASLPEVVPDWIYQAAGAALIIAGAGCKYWAAHLTGLDTYYYRDMFAGHQVAVKKNNGFVLSGPYRIMENPMYGVGNFVAYGGALWYQSWAGLVVAAAMQASIYLFYSLFERPFVERTYLANMSS
ncbi:MAG: PEMT/PEM2 methyltransferase family protein [Planctomycetota bacterium]